MEHVVFYPSPDASPAFRRTASLEEAVQLVEQLRNVEGVTDVTVHALSEVPLAFTTYVHVAVSAPGHVSLPVEAPAAEVPAAEATAVEVPVAETPSEPVAEEARPEVVAAVEEPAQAAVLAVEPSVEPSFAVPVETVAEHAPSLGLVAHEPWSLTPVADHVWSTELAPAELPAPALALVPEPALEAHVEAPVEVPVEVPVESASVPVPFSIPGFELPVVEAASSSPAPLAVVPPQATAETAHALADEAPADPARLPEPATHSSLSFFA